MHLNHMPLSLLIPLLMPAGAGKCALIGNHQGHTRTHRALRSALQVTLFKLSHTTNSFLLQSEKQIQNL